MESKAKVIESALFETLYMTSLRHLRRLGGTLWGDELLKELRNLLRGLATPASSTFKYI